MNRRRQSIATLAFGAALLTATIAAGAADAQRARPGGGAQRAQVNRGASNRAGMGQARQQHQVRRDASASLNGNRGQNIDRDRNVNRDVNRNVDRDINRDLNVDVDVHHEYGYGYDWDDHYHPVARAAVATAAVVTTAAVIGSMVRTIPPSCVTVVRVGLTYYQCGSTWYQPSYVGSTVQYVVVAAP